MDRTDAVALVAAAIDAHRGVTHLRFISHGSYGPGRPRVEVVTLGARGPGVKRPRGTAEQRRLTPSRTGSLNRQDLTLATPDAWETAFALLAPDVVFASGAYETTRFDVDRDGRVSRRNGSRHRNTRRARRLAKALRLR